LKQSTLEVAVLALAAVNTSTHGRQKTRGLERADNWW